MLLLGILQAAALVLNNSEGRPWPAAPCTTLSDVLDSVRAVGRLILGPLTVAVFAAVELSRYGVLTATSASYLIFAATQGVVISWNRYQLRRARRRLTLQRMRTRTWRSRSREGRM